MCPVYFVNYVRVAQGVGIYYKLLLVYINKYITTP